ncbi:glutamate synthase [Sulfurifustis variabilis]|uniref:Glutamate synthase n=1 Tax=Sulfurifustis variabilis TaxID=1675686 RepID=A0A1C7AEZ2_9GAMM|nr:NAD(P)-binding protein [Sulfurifustis variabilis]BAU49772.1 glutamate synthase [Sulfurifustis variabilis]
MSRLAFEPGSSTAYRTGDWRLARPVYADKWPPCGAACPAGEDIQAYLALIEADRPEAAWRKLTEQNPFPAVCGRICPHPCEGACNRARLDEAVAIHHVERHLGDLARTRGFAHDVPRGARADKRVAVVGAGPAGLSCAYHLARAGYPVTVYDAASEPGGTLRWGVPDYRLPKDALAREIEAILALGVTLRLGMRIGADLGAAELRAQHDAVFLAIGARLPHVPAEGEVSGRSVEYGIDFLDRVNRGERPVLPARVAVIGAGNTAIDVARCARRFGATEVTIVSPQDRPGRRPGQPAEEMKATPSEIAEAEAEGVRLLLRWGVQRLVRSGQHLDGVQLAQVDRVHDDRGRFKPVLYEGTEMFLPAGYVIVATGQHPDWSGLEALRPDPAAGVYAGGDCAGAPRTAAAAIGSGHQGAEDIMAFLEDRAPVNLRRPATVTFEALHTQYYRRLPRRAAAEIDPIARLRDFREAVTGLDAVGAAYEAGRCLSCGVCLECDNCWHFCPDAAVIKQGPGERYRFDYEYCKGCGICAAECPCGHIHMEPEPVSL